MAFAQRLFEQHGGVVKKYFKRLTGDATAAEDLTQEGFLRVVRSGDAYEHRDRERAWVFASHAMSSSIFADRRCVRPVQILD
jgi:DNA-directed RNA polymerase specialized sigma24 family protein